AYLATVNPVTAEERSTDVPGGTKYSVLVGLGSENHDKQERERRERHIEAVQRQCGYRDEHADCRRYQHCNENIHWNWNSGPVADYSSKSSDDQECGIA